MLHAFLYKAPLWQLLLEDVTSFVNRYVSSLPVLITYLFQPEIYIEFHQILFEGECTHLSLYN